MKTDVAVAVVVVAVGWLILGMVLIHIIVRLTQ